MSQFDLSLMTYFWLINLIFDKFRVKLSSVFIAGFRDSFCIFSIAEIIVHVKNRVNWVLGTSGT